MSYKKSGNISPHHYAESFVEERNTNKRESVFFFLVINADSSTVNRLLEFFVCETFYGL